MNSRGRRDSVSCRSEVYRVLCDSTSSRRERCVRRRTAGPQARSSRPAAQRTRPPAAPGSAGSEPPLCSARSTLSSSSDLQVLFTRLLLCFITRDAILLLCACLLLAFRVGLYAHAPDRGVASVFTRDTSGAFLKLKCKSSN